MSGDIGFGKCDICLKPGELSRKYYYYDIKCECCSGDHFEIVHYCKNCKPKPPDKTTIYIQPITIVPSRK